MLRDFRKPLMIAAPKIGLKHQMAVSPLQEFEESQSFKPIIVHQYKSATPSDKHRVIFCSGKVSFDLQQLISQASDQLSQNIILVKVEELAPFPSTLIESALQPYAQNIDSFTWIQEEPAN